MRCEQFEEQLQELWDQRGATWPPAMLAHAGRCPSCRQLAQDFLALQKGLARSAALGVPAGFAKRVVEQHQGGQHQGEPYHATRNRPAIRFSRAVGATRLALVAASVAIIIGLAAWRYHDRARQATPRTIVGEETALASAANRERLEQIYRELIDSRLQEIGENRAAWLDLVWNGSAPKPGEEDAGPFDFPVIRRSRWVADMTDEIQPVAHSVAEAMGGVILAMPPAERPALLQAGRLVRLYRVLRTPSPSGRSPQEPTSADRPA